MTTKIAEAGQKVRVINDQGTDLFKAGEVYTVLGRGECELGKGVITVEKGSLYVLTDDNYTIVGKVERPEPLTLQGFLKALADGEAVVSVDEDDDISDTYHSLSQLEDDITYFEIMNNQFYLQDDWTAYLKNLEKEKNANQTKGREVEFAVAIVELKNGKTIVSRSKHGTKIDQYNELEDLKKLTVTEAKNCTWFVIE